MAKVLSRKSCFHSHTELLLLNPNFYLYNKILNLYKILSHHFWIYFFIYIYKQLVAITIVS